MRLVDLNPRWVGSGGEGVYSPTGHPCPTCPPDRLDPDCRTCFGRGKEYEPAKERHGVGLSFNCPCQPCTSQRVGDDDKDFHLRVFVAFTNPLDGGPMFDQPHRPHWDRTGDTFDTLVLRPSILSVPGKGGCGWHGFIGGASGDKPGDVETC